MLPDAAQLLDAAESGGWAAIQELLAVLRKGKEVGQAKARGTREERIAKAMQMKEPDQFFGYNRERRPDESPSTSLRMVWCAWSPK